MSLFKKDLVDNFNQNPRNSIDKNGNLIIPFGVTEIGDNAFYGCEKIKNVVIPESVTSIKGSAFRKCCNMEQINIPDSVTSIGGHAFSECTRLKKLDIPNSVQDINVNAFFACKSLESVKLPDGIEEIGLAMFHSCSSLKNIIIPESVTNISSGAFQECSSLESIVIPESVTNIGVNVFTSCTSLKNIVLPKNMKSIGNGTFYECEKLESIVIPQGIESILQGTFSWCLNLKNITLPDSLKTIGHAAFNGCVDLSEIKLPESMTSISGHAFHACGLLKNITIPNSVKYLGSSAFTGSGIESIVIPDSIATIEQNAFHGCTKLKSVTIPDSVNTIEQYAFASSGIESIFIPSSVITIEQYAFGDCKKLRSIILSDGIKTLDDNIFSGSDKIDSLTICGKQINLHQSKRMRIFGNDQIRECFYANKYNKQLKPFIDKQIQLPPEMIEILIYQDIINEEKSFNCKHLCNELDYMFKHDQNLQLEFKHATIESKLDFYKLANKMGVFSNDNQLSQKASSAIVSLLKDRVFSMGDFHKYLDIVNLNHPNNKVFEFLNSKNKNLPQIIELERSYPKILAKIINNYNSFLDCKTVIDSNGKPKKLNLKDAAIKLYTETTYDNVTFENSHIAAEFAKFSLGQEHFDEAIELKEKSDKQKNILNGSFIETSLFEQIENIKNDTENKIVSAQTLAKEFLEKKFTYEILNKQDPRNLILGAYCSCCANINSHFYGKNIAISSFTSSNVDNIVVKNSEGAIIAKGTIYVNRENGYGVINDFELNDKYKRDGYKTDDKQLIFNTFKRAVGSFVNKYNEQNKKPITKVNVGLGYNRLAEYTKELPKEKTLLNVPDKYGFHDAESDQYTLYKSDEKTQ